MGSPLGSIYSAIDSQKRRLIDALRNPRLAAEQAVGRANDDARVLNEMTAAAAKEGLKYGPASEALAMKMADAYNPAGITVWHGSPHKFDRFDASKIGTGEGAQAYGHGIYTAEARGVGADYANVLASPRNRVSDRRGVYIEPSPMGGGKYMLATKSEVGQPRGMAADATQFIYPEKEFSNLASAMKFARRQGLLDRNERPRLTAINEDRWYVPVTKAADVAEPEYTQFIASDPGYLYKVDLPDEHVAKMLDWDKPLSQQHPDVQKALSEYGDMVGGSDWQHALKTDDRGSWFYRLLEDVNRNSPRGAASDTANDLRQAGIPGIRYLDGGSRGTGAGTSNFVVFPGNEDVLQILERNGQPVIDALRKRK